MNDDGGDEGDDDRREEEPVDVLPGRQREHVEREIVMEDRVLRAEGHAVEGACERDPRSCRTEADHDGDDQREHQADLSHAPRRILVHVLDDVDALEGAVLGRDPARERDVAVDDGEEGAAEQGAQHQPHRDALPEHGPEGDLAEPQPVDVERATVSSATMRTTTDHDRDDHAPGARPAPSTWRFLLVTPAKRDHSGHASHYERVQPHCRRSTSASDAALAVDAVSQRTLPYRNRRSTANFAPWTVLELWRLSDAGACPTLAPLRRGASRARRRCSAWVPFWPGRCSTQAGARVETG